MGMLLRMKWVKNAVSARPYWVYSYCFYSNQLIPKQLTASKLNRPENWY